jgi:ATP-binding cassette subfamily F protein 3
MQALQRQQLATRLKPLKKELEQAERRMAALEDEKLQLEARLSTMLPPAEIADAGRRLKAVSDELGELEERWLELSGEIESAESPNG